MAKVEFIGHSCFQISFSPSKDETVRVLIDPFDDSIGLAMPSLSAEIVLITHNHSDHNNIKRVKGSPFLVSGAGEYEIKKIFIEGISSFHDDSEGKERGGNTIYTIEGENIRFCHLGDLGQKQLSEEQLEKIGIVDVLMIPVGGTYTIDALSAQKIISQIEPKIVIPMHYAVPNLKIKLDRVENFLKAFGKSQLVPHDKLVVKAGSLPEDEMEIVLLKTS